MELMRCDSCALVHTPCDYYISLALISGGTQIIIDSCLLFHTIDLKNIKLHTKYTEI